MTARDADPRGVAGVACRDLLHMSKGELIARCARLTAELSAMRTEIKALQSIVGGEITEQEWTSQAEINSLTRALDASRAETAAARNAGLEEAARIAESDWTPAYGPHDDKMERFAELQRSGIVYRIRAARVAAAAPDHAGEVDRLTRLLEQPERQAMGFHERHAVLYARASAAEADAAALRAEIDRLERQAAEKEWVYNEQVDKLAAAQAVATEAREYLPIYDGEPDGHSASVRLGLIRTVAALVDHAPTCAGNASAGSGIISTDALAADGTGRVGGEDGT